MNAVSRFALVLLILFQPACVVSQAQLSGGPLAGPDAALDESSGQAWWAHIRYLADDSMKGRQTGSEEFLKAAAYVVDQFKSWGLEPAGVNGTYYQPVHFDVQRVIATKSALALVMNGKQTPLSLGDDAILGTRMLQPATIDAPLVFIGYGLHLPEAGYDDFDSAELPRASLKGKVVVLVNGGPRDLPGPRGSRLLEYRSTDQGNPRGRREQE